MSIFTAEGIKCTALDHEVFTIAVSVLLQRNKMWQRFSIHVKRTAGFRAQSPGRQNQTPSIQANAATYRVRARE
jgi:hypothetical protein